MSDKVYIEYDDIEHGIIEDLTARGIAEENVVLAYLPQAEIITA